MNTSAFDMYLDAQPAPDNSKKVTIRLRPVKPFPIENSHGKPIHLILVSEDLSWFSHVHPEPGWDGHSVTVEFPFGGTFYAFADFVPEGGHQIIRTYSLTINAEPETPRHFRQSVTTSVSGEYTLTLKPLHGPLSSGHVMLEGALQKGDTHIDPVLLEDYLGEKAHAVLIHQESKAFVHVHPEVRNGRFVLHAELPEPGIYRAWIQFQANGTVHTTDFVLEAKAGHGAAHNGHGHHYGHGHHH